MKKNRVLFVGSHMSVKGGIVSVLKNYMNNEYWKTTAIFFVPTHRETNKLGKILYFCLGYFRILFFLIFKKIDIVHIHVSERGSFFRKAKIVLLCKRFKKKVILHHHGAEFHIFYEGLSEKKKQYVKRIIGEVDCNIVLSKRLIPVILNINKEASIKVLYNAVKTYRCNPYHMQARGILFLGRLGSRKGIYDFLECIKMLDSLISPDITFYLCGDGEIDKVKERIAKLGIQKRISYIGWIDKEQKKEILAKTMIHVLPSYNEGLPMAILETMAYGIPNISTNIASIPEVITDKKTGFLIEPGESKRCAVIIEELIHNEALRFNVSEQSYQFINQTFSLKKHIEVLEEIYQELKKNRINK